MITMLLAGTVFHQILVVELPATGKTQLQPGDARHRVLSVDEARALSDSLEGAGASLVTAPSILEAEGEGAELSVSSEEASFRLFVRESRGSTHVELRIHEGRRIVADVNARFAVPDGGMFTIPIDARHLLIGRQDRLADGETTADAAAAWQKSWSSLLNE